MYHKSKHYNLSFLWIWYILYVFIVETRPSIPPDALHFYHTYRYLNFTIMYCSTSLVPLITLSLTISLVQIQE